MPAFRGTTNKKCSSEMPKVLIKASVRADHLFSRRRKSGWKAGESIFLTVGELTLFMLDIFWVVRFEWQ